MRILILLLLIFSACYARATEESPFTVHSLAIYAEAHNLDDARIEALEQGKIEASKILFARILPSSLQWKVDKLNLANIDNYLTGYEVKWERMTSISYRAVVDFTFDPENIRDFLNSSGVTYGSQYQPKTLMIQFDEYDDIVALDDFNRSSGLKFEKNFGLSKFALMAGDLKDEELTEVIYFATADFTMFGPLLNRYQAEQAAIVKLTKIGKYNILLLRLLSSRYNVVLYKLLSDGELSFAGLIAQSIIDDYYKGSKHCLPVRKYFALLKPDLDALRSLQAMGDCVDLRKRGNSYEVKFSEKPDVFSKVLLAAGIKIDKQGKATIILPPLASDKQK